MRLNKSLSTVGAAEPMSRKYAPAQEVEKQNTNLADQPER